MTGFLSWEVLKNRGAQGLLGVVPWLALWAWSEVESSGVSKLAAV